MKTDVLLIHPPANFNLPKGAVHALPSYHVGYGMLHIASTLLLNGFNVVVWNLGEALHLDNITSRRFGKIIRGGKLQVSGHRVKLATFQ